MCHTVSFLSNVLCLGRLYDGNSQSQQTTSSLSSLSIFPFLHPSLRLDDLSEMLLTPISLALVPSVSCTKSPSAMNAPSNVKCRRALKLSSQPPGTDRLMFSRPCHLEVSLVLSLSTYFLPELLFTILPPKSHHDPQV